MSANALGIVSIMGAMMLISLQDAMVKQFSSDYALHEIMVVRAGVALSLMLLFLAGVRQLRQNRRKKPQRPVFLN